MKFIVKVVVEKEIELNFVGEYFFTDEYLKEFGSYIGYDRHYDLEDSDQRQCAIAEIVKCAARQVYDAGMENDTDGIGFGVTKCIASLKDKYDFTYDEQYDDIEVEILNG